MNGGKGEQPCKVGTGDRRICSSVPHRQCGCLCLAAIHTGCIRTGFGGDVCRGRSAAFYWRIRRPCIDPNGASSLLSAQEIPGSIVLRHRETLERRGSCRRRSCALLSLGSYSPHPMIQQGTVQGEL